MKTSITKHTMASRRLGAALLLAGVCAANAAHAQSKTEPIRPVAPRGVDDANIIRVLLAPAQETTLASQLSARIQSMNVTLGETFAKGKPLVRFECDEQQARLKMSEAELASARESHEAKLRLQGLQQAGEVEVSMAASNAERARAQVELTRAQLNQCAVVAPFSGRVVKVAAKPFQSVSAGQALLEIVSDGPLKLRLNVPGKWVSWLKKGARFAVQIDETGKQYAASITAINGRIDAVSQTVEVEAAIDQRAPDLLPGMSGTARLAQKGS